MQAISKNNTKVMKNAGLERASYVSVIPKRWPLMLRIRAEAFSLSREQISSIWELMFFLILLSHSSTAAKNIGYQRDPITYSIIGGNFSFHQPSSYCDQREQKRALLAGFPSDNNTAHPKLSA